MAITYPISFPTTIGIQNFSMKLRSVVARTESPFSLVDQVVQYPGERWEISVGLPPLSYDDAEEFKAFLMKLGGKYGTFTIGDPARSSSPRGSWATSGSILVKGASQTGNTLIIDGLTPSQTNIARAGDYIQIGTGSATRLHKVVEDADSNASGEATLTIVPKLRASPADNAAVITSGAVGLFRLTSNLNGWDTDPESDSISFSAIEVL